MVPQDQRLTHSGLCGHDIVPIATPSFLGPNYDLQYSFQWLSIILAIGRNFGRLNGATGSGGLTYSGSSGQILSSRSFRNSAARRLDSCL